MRSLFLILISVILSLTAFHFLNGEKAVSTQSETTFDRVMRTGVIRCGYYVFPPITYRDPNTKALSGLSVDMMNEIGKRAGLKIEWAEEVNFANWPAALQAKRFDVMCTPAWPDIPLGRVVLFTEPMMYAGIYPLIRADDPKLRNAPLERFNQKDVRIVTQDGNGIDTIARAAFPNATINSMPATMDGPSIMQEILTNKSDLVLLDRNAEVMYNKGRPNTFTLRDDLPPVRVQAFTLSVSQRDPDMKLFLDNATLDLLDTGEMSRIIDKWEEVDGTFLRVGVPYKP